MQASIAQSEENPTGDQDVAGRSLPWSGNIFFMEIDYEIFSTVILHLLLISRRAVVNILKTSLQVGNIFHGD